MSRNLPVSSQPSAAEGPAVASSAKPVLISRSLGQHVGTFWDMLAIRLVFTAICTGAGYHFRPFTLSPLIASLAGLLFAVAVILFEVRLRRASLRRLIGAAVGSILGLTGAYLTTLVLSHTSMPVSTRSFISLAAFLVMAYIGLILGANKGDMLNLSALGGSLGAKRAANTPARCSTPR
jgi:uncharacterized protein YacL